MNASMIRERTRSISVLRLLASLILAISFALAWTHTSGPVCIWRTLFHVPCPGCGLTRSMEAIWRGQLLLSFRYHPIGIPLFLGCWTVLLRKREPLSEAQYQRGFRLTLMVFALMFLLWLIRLALAKAGNTFFLW